MRKYILFLATIYSFNSFSITISGTYSAGKIPTSFSAYSASCNGAATPLNITLPAGCWQVTGIDIVYQMTGTGSGWMSEQQSRVKSDLCLHSIKLNSCCFKILIFTSSNTIITILICCWVSISTNQYA